MSPLSRCKRLFRRPHLRLIALFGVIVPRRLRANWRQEWEAELRHREELLAKWDRLDWRQKLDLLRRSASGFRDALWLQPKRLEDEMFQDLRYGVRMMRRAPGFTAVATLALALGIGVNSAVLSAVNGFVLRPLPMEKPVELLAPRWGRKMDTQVWGQFSYANYMDLREQNKSFSDLCAWMVTAAGISSSENRTAGEGERAEVVWGELVSGNYFDVMGVKPMLGRGFLPEEDRTPNTHPVVALSHSLWQRRFNGDAGVVGRTIYLNGLPFTVIGVMPESFLGSAFYLRQAFWAPLMMGQKFGHRAEWETDRSYALVRGCEWR